MIFDAIVDSHNVDTVMVEATSIRAHPSATKLKVPDKRRCLGRSRDGLGTKIHASNNQDGVPLKLELSLGQAHDAPVCETLLTGPQPGQWALADKAYDADWIRNMIWEQGAIDLIPSKSNRKIPKEFDKELYRQRNKIDRFFCRLKASFRRIATRYKQTSLIWAEVILQINRVTSIPGKPCISARQFNTHKAASFYKAFPPAEAPFRGSLRIALLLSKHGSWFSIAEYEQRT